MADDVFGDPSLFEEFEKTRDSSDVILLSKLKKEASQARVIASSNNGLSANETGLVASKNDVSVTVRRSSLSSDSESDSLHSDSDSEYDESLQADNGPPDNYSTVVSQNANTIADSDTDDDARICELRKHIDIDKLSKPHRYQERLQQLKSDNHQLREQSRLIDTGKYFQDKEGPAIQVLYMDHEVAMKYKGEIERFISQLLQQSSNIDTESKSVPSKENRSSTAENGNISNMKQRKVIGCSQLYRYFTVDAVGWPLQDLNPAKSDGWDIPQYTQQLLSALSDAVEEEEKEPVQRKPRPKASCFNCGGEHQMRECKERRNTQRIRENRQQFQGSQKFGKTRYHGDVHRFSKFSPGVISEGLRDALQLRPHQLPDHIYRMRVLGYPPGHLAAARVQTSGLVLFDKDGQPVAEEDDAIEDGEIDTENIVKVEHDISKIISYAGFNMDIPPGTRDECRRLNMPPMQPQHRKEVLELFLSSSSGESGVKRPSSHDSAKRNKKMRSEEMDMDVVEISDSDADVVVDVTDVADSGQTSRSATPGLEELEAQQLHLLLQLEAAESGERTDAVELQVLDEYHPSPMKPPLPRDTPPPTPSPAAARRTPMKLPEPRRHGRPPSPPPLPIETPPRNPPLPAGTPPVTPANANPVTPPTPQTGDETVAVAVAVAAVSFSSTPGSGGSLSVECSTPVLNMDTGIPNAARFAECVSEHIPYENLPNATGTFARMRRVLKAVRSKKPT